MGFILTDPANLRIQLQLRNGSIHDLAKQGEDYQIMKFDRYDLTLDIPGTEHSLWLRLNLDRLS